MPHSRLVLVTGASRGIGRALSLKLLDVESRVVGIGRDFFHWSLPRTGFEAVAADLAELDGLPDLLSGQECAAGVRVGIVNPGLVQTGFFDGLDFCPGAAPENAIAPEDVADAIIAMLGASPGTVVDEINLSPLKEGHPHRFPRVPQPCSRSGEGVNFGGELRRFCSLMSLEPRDRGFFWFLVGGVGLGSVRRSPLLKWALCPFFVCGESGCGTWRAS